MIGKLKKGSSFVGCVRYVTGKDEAKILASDGVLLGTNAEIVRKFRAAKAAKSKDKEACGTHCIELQTRGQATFDG